MDLPGLMLFLFPAMSGKTQGPARTSFREKIDLDAGWKFSLTDTAGAAHPGFDDSRWRTVQLPHDWSIEGEFDEKAATGGGGGYLPTGVGWYRKHFVLPKTALGKSVWVEFEGVYQNSDVWINDHHLGHYPNGYMSFYYDLSPFIHAGANILSVRVDNSLQPNSRWYSGSGHLPECLAVYRRTAACRPMGQLYHNAACGQRLGRSPRQDDYR